MCGGVEGYVSVWKGGGICECVEGYVSVWRDRGWRDM